MRRRLLVSFVLFAFIATALLVIPIGFTLNAHENAATLNALRRDATAASTLLADDLGDGRLTQATTFARTYSRTTGRQILVTSAGGVIIATKRMQVSDGQITRIARSVGAAQLSGVLPRSAVEGRQYYVAMRLPVTASPTPSLGHAVLVMTFPVTVVTRVVRSNWRNLGVYGLLMLLVACGLGFLISTSLTRPVRRIGSAVEAIGAGQLHTRAPTDEGPPELRRLAAAINATSSRLIGLLEVQKSFVEDASHQLRTPLTALQLHLENLQHKSERPSPDDFTPLLVEMGRLNRLVESLLELARNEARPILLATVDLDAIARERTHYWQPLAEELGITLTVENAASEPALAIDGVVEQAIDNLLSNAFDATPTGGSIRVVTRSTQRHAHLHVIDTGVGLSAQERQLALRRFWRGRHNPADGSGLGLAVVDQLIRLCGGSVELLESPSGGVDACVTLNLASPTSPDSP